MAAPACEAPPFFPVRGGSAAHETVGEVSLPTVQCVEGALPMSSAWREHFSSAWGETRGKTPFLTCGKTADT